MPFCGLRVASTLARTLSVRVADGTLTGVSAVDGQGQALPGDLTPDGTGWQSSQTLIPETAYTVEVTAAVVVAK
mgnify:CR=1 FL=1